MDLRETYRPHGWPDGCPVPYPGNTYPPVAALARYFNEPYRQFTREEVAEMRAVWRLYVTARGFRLMWCASTQAATEGNS